MNDPNAPGGQQPPAPPPPPPSGQGWQSTPQPPGPPPMGGQPSGMPSWTNNLTARGTIAGPGGVALADATSRFVATFIDFLILGVIGFIVNTISTGILGDQLNVFGLLVTTARFPSLISSLVTVVIMLVISGGYFIYQWSRMNGMTVGDRVMKLSVRDASTGGAITQQQAINRWLLLGAPLAIEYLYGWGIGFIVALVVLVWYIYLIYTIAQSPTRQGMHDTYAKTVVAKVG